MKSNCQFIPSPIRKALGRFPISRLIGSILVTYLFVGWPVKPPKDLQSTDMYEIYGAPVFRETLTSKMSDTYFFVNGFRLNCTLGLLDGLNGCAFFRRVVDEEMPVRATYYYMPTRIGLRYPMLYCLEQNKEIVVSPELMQVNLTRNYETRWSIYLYISIFFLFVLIVALFIDRANANRKENNLLKE